MEIDFERYVVRVAGRLIPLTYFQFTCLRLLARRRETVVFREELCRALWGDYTHDQNLRLNSQLSALRHRLRRNPLDDTGSTVRVEQALKELFGA